MTMTPAELRTKRQALGLTPKYIADVAAMHRNVAWQSEAPAARAVHPEIEAAFTNLADVFYAEVDSAVIKARALGRIERISTPAAFHKAHPALTDWPDKSIGAFYAEVHRETDLPIIYTTGK